MLNYSQRFLSSQRSVSALLAFEVDEKRHFFDGNINRLWFVSNRMDYMNYMTSVNAKCVSVSISLWQYVDLVR